MYLRFYFSPFFLLWESIFKHDNDYGCRASNTLLTTDSSSPYFGNKGGEKEAGIGQSLAQLMMGWDRMNVETILVVLASGGS